MFAISKQTTTSFYPTPYDNLRANTTKPVCEANGQQTNPLSPHHLSSPQIKERKKKKPTHSRLFFIRNPFHHNTHNHTSTQQP